ncbi:hypothetical protein EDB80DRAFT_893015 [Ilyonectria destructans]|nr:hypothetical protein EDB80DRAFT_893015 [Ilyonectria destructans]
MSALRTSRTLFRSQLRPVAGVTAPHLRRTQVRFLGGDEGLGGPGGQKPPPPKPGGPEALKRNWVPIGGALLLLAGVSYISSADKPVRPREADLKTVNVHRD